MSEEKKELIETIENETNGQEPTKDEDLPTEIDGAAEGEEDIQETVPEKVREEKTKESAKAPKSLTGVVIALAFVIVCLIVVLIITIINKNQKDSENENPSPSKTLNSDITVTPDDSSETGKNGEESETIPTQYEMPEFNVTTVLGKYKGVEVDYDLPEVTEEDIEGALEYFRESLEEDVDIEGRPLKEGDTAVIDYVGKMDGEEFEGGSDTDFDLTLGSHMFIDGFEEGLIGKNIGETVTLELTFPDPYPNNTDYSGKPVTFEVTINSAYECVTPELTDEIVAENSTCQTIQEYRDMARKELEEQAKEYADSQLKNDIINKVIEGATFSGQIDEQIAYEEQDAIDYYDSMCMSNYNISGAAYFGYIWGITEDEYYNMVHEEAEMSIKYNYVLDEIAKAEGYTVSEEEYKAKFEQTFYEDYGFTSEEEVYSQISKEQAREVIEGYVLHDKAEALIMDTAVVNNRPEE